MVKFSHSKSQKKIYHKLTWDIEWKRLELKRRPETVVLMCFEVKDLLFSLRQFTCIRTDVTLCVA